MTATVTTTAPAALGEPAPGTPEALLLLATAGVLPAGAGADDPRFSADAITSCVSRLLEVKQQQDLLASEQKELNEQLRLAHLRGDLLTCMPAGKDGNGYQITPDLVLNRRPGRKQWRYSIDCKEIECQLKARQSYEQQSGLASYSLGAAFWEVRATKG
ncbi:hypothetical protein SynWH8101_1009 [Synechococcus sp. WH 8101]|jgi:hypothetical protein|uniref:hypothetical protein n=1 Tax=unclassified Synechococcus TaxID=2626047 RepID=UPI0010237B00|nr:MULTISPECIES: hypothetical protein [unclassified Synechococcus]QBE68597.1 hypothetical protein SynWH8101_1009 [Synechococcus sp. WH 8101]QNI44816.1 hypothetical protein SynRCC2555_01030 [Synechococcus sp. WH 8101]QVV67941.1 hypothetical protein KJJ24_01725 [Synechococcus sp. LA31]